MKHNVTSSNYRKDIDGLRGRAVSLVLFFHFFPNYLPSGFVGVDIFFVISGYLITTIVVSDQKNNNFDLLSFYIKRVNRILPALIVVIVAVLITGWFGLLADEYKQLGLHVFSSSVFLSNVTLLKESGYFDTVSESKPLLHLWSLAIEEQFYLLWPLLLLYTRTFKRQMAACILTTLVSLFWCIYLTPLNSTYAFYLPFTRIWELLLGGCAAIVISSRPHLLRGVHSSALFGVGIFFLFISLMFDKSKWNFPGFFALFPVLSALFIILSGVNGVKKSLIVDFFIKNRLIVAVGLISYPLYLWHWPLVSFAHIFYEGFPPRIVKYSLLIVSFLLSVLTYLLIEKPMKKRKMNHKVSLVLFVMLFFLGGVGGLAYVSDGFASRQVVQNNIGFDNKNLAYNYNNKKECLFGRSFDEVIAPLCSAYVAEGSKKTIVIWGDSSAGSWAPPILDIAFEKKYSVFVIEQPSCPPIVGVKKTDFLHPESRSYCSRLDLGERVIEAIEALNPDYIIWAGAWQAYMPLNAELKTTLRTEYITSVENDVQADEASSIKALNEQIPHTLARLSSVAKVIVLKAWPRLSSYPRYSIRRFSFLEGFDQPTYKFYNDHIAESERINMIFDDLVFSNTILIDPSKLNCDDLVCRSVVKGVKLYKDEYHLTVSGAMLLRSEFEKNIH